MRDRVNAILTALAVVAVVLLASAFVVGPLFGQTVTLSGDSAKIGFSVTVPRVHDTTTVYDTVTVHDTVRVQPPILRADTTITSRIAGDTTYTIRQIVTLRGYVDTVTSQTFILAVKDTTKPDSVRITVPKVYAKDSTKIALNIYTYPTKTKSTVSARWLVNGKQVATSSQIGYATTILLPRPTTATATVQACAKRSGDLSETCSNVQTFTQPGVSVTPVPTPPGVSITSFALGSALPVSPRVLPIWAQYAGSALRVMVRDSASGWNVDFKVPPTAMGPIDTLLAAIDHPVGTIPLPAGPLVLSACAEVQAADSLFYHLCAPTARLP